MEKTPLRSPRIDVRAGSYGVELLDYEGVSYGLDVDVGIDVYDYH